MVGNWAAVTQENSKRLLAYSSISNAGYPVAGTRCGKRIRLHRTGRLSAGLHVMNMGAFGVIISLRRRGIIGDNVDDLTGLGTEGTGCSGNDGALHVVAAVDYR